MKRILAIAAAALCLAACGNAPEEQKVMARHVPERADDFVWENDLIAGRIYGKALEGNPTSPGIDIWVKTPGALVADDWYAHAVEDPDYYHHDHGGKDCYKVAVSLGGGASAPVIEGRIQYPATNWRSCEILEQKADKVVFVLHYPEWQAGETSISLDKKITVCAGTYFCKAEDTYTFSGEAEELEVAAGVYRHAYQDTIEEEIVLADRYALWEHASDQSIEPEDGMVGVAVYVPGATFCGLSHGDEHGICSMKVRSGETFTYWFGSCWSKGEIKTAGEWFENVKNLQ